MSADYPSMTTAEIRSKFLNFFEERGLKLYPSSSLVPDDPSLLLANAGMNQFKEYYQGKKTMKEIGAISCQKCVRTNDIDCIGEDGRHLSFFEMLGDFSFGGVSKQQACAWAFELITKEFKLPLDRLYFTVFTEDDETHDVWRSLGVAEDHISRLGEDDNFWRAGPTGPAARAPRSTLTWARRSVAAAPTASLAATAIASLSSGTSSLPSTTARRTAPCRSCRTATSIRAWAWSAWPPSCSTRPPITTVI